MRNVLCTLTLATLAICAGPAWAKTQTVRIEITGTTLGSPLNITDSAVLDRFNIWNGPGVSVNGQPVHMKPNDNQGRFIDWPGGIASARPSGAYKFTIVFHQDDLRQGSYPLHEWHKRYVVQYEYRPGEPGGYIYLPGQKDGEVYGRNTFSIAHGVEGNWFHASNAWEQVVRPLIEQALARSELARKKASSSA